MSDRAPSREELIRRLRGDDDFYRRVLAIAQQNPPQQQNRIKPNYAVVIPLNDLDEQQEVNAMVIASRQGQEAIEKIQTNNQEFTVHMNKLKSFNEINREMAIIFGQTNRQQYRVQIHPTLIVSQGDSFFIKISNVPVFKDNNGHSVPFRVSNRRELNDAMRQLVEAEWRNYPIPDSFSRVIGVSHVQIDITIIPNSPLGKLSEELPKLLKNNRSVFHFANVEHNLCFFWCLSTAIRPDISDERRRVKHVAQLFRETYGQDASYVDYEGFDIWELTETLLIIEERYKVSFGIWDYEEVEGKLRGTKIRSSPFECDDSFTHHDLLIHNDEHIMYIKDVAVLFKNYACCKCKKSFDHLHHCIKHQKECSSESKFKFDKHSRLAMDKRPNTLEFLARRYPDIPWDGDFIYPWRAGFDYESFFSSLNQASGDTTIYLSKHIPTSLVVAGSKALTDINPYFDGQFFCLKNYLPEGGDIHQSDVGKYIMEMNLDAVGYLLRMEKIAEQEALTKWKSFDDYFKDKLTYHEDYIKKFESQEELTEDQQKRYKYHQNKYNKLTKDYHQFLKYCKQMPVFGFSSRRYDLSLNKSFGLFQCLLDMDEVRVENNSVQDMIKKGSSEYLKISTDRLLVLDLQSYVSSGTKLSELYESILGYNAKEIIPYEYLTSIKVLDTLVKDIPMEAFFSVLKNKGITQREYDEFQLDCQTRGFHTLYQVLEYYNLQDVRPMMTVIDKLQEGYTEFHLDMGKDVVSASGYASRAGNYVATFQHIEKRLAHESFKFDSYVEPLSLAQARAKIEGYKQQDMNRHRSDLEKDYEIPKDYITPHEMVNLFERQERVCYYCRYSVEGEDITLDRLNNYLDHTHTNCVIACKECNTIRGDRYSWKEFRHRIIKAEFLAKNPRPLTINEKNKQFFYDTKASIAVDWHNLQSIC